MDRVRTVRRTYEGTALRTRPSKRSSWGGNVERYLAELKALESGWKWHKTGNDGIALNRKLNY